MSSLDKSIETESRLVVARQRSEETESDYLLGTAFFFVATKKHNIVNELNVYFKMVNFMLSDFCFKYIYF